MTSKRRSGNMAAVFLLAPVQAVSGTRPKPISWKYRQRQDQNLENQHYVVRSIARGRLHALRRYCRQLRTEHFEGQYSESAPQANHAFTRARSSARIRRRNSAADIYSDYPSAQTIPSTCHLMFPDIQTTLMSLRTFSGGCMLYCLWKDMVV